MKSQRILLSFIKLLVIVAVIVLGRPAMFPSDTEPVTDQFLSKTATPRVSSFSDLLSQGDADFARALKQQKFSFPYDYGAHNLYRTEWWYFTGNLENSEGRKFGYELTFFRFALSTKAQSSRSVWRSNQLYMAHLTLTDVKENRFYTNERFGRAGNELAGADNDKYHVWLYDWSATAEGNIEFPLRLRAKRDQFAIDLLLNTQKSLVLQGEQGLSQKSAEPGNASYYYSYTRLPTQGTLTIADDNYAVTGNSWMDREWSTSSLSKEQSGWDWFALQFSDNTELMFYRLRRKDGQQDNNSAGSLVLADGTIVPLKMQDATIDIQATWQSPHSGINYPSRWRLSVPSQKLAVEIVPLINDQELNVSFRYWEGAVRIDGTKNGKAISGQGYVELTGYQ
ncbi:MAG: lipocalin-like domain-containing protein [Methylobacter sp.]